MRYQTPVIAMLALAISGASAQMASHAPTAAGNPTPVSAQVAAPQVSDKPVARVNGAVLTDRDLLREMYTIFPYAQQHNGFPKAQEASIRQGALEMIIFEELVYQEAVRRRLVISAEKLNRATAEFRQQFKSPDQYQQYLQSEMKGSEQQLRQQIRRSLLIEQVLKTDVEVKSAVTSAEVQAYYVKNAARFQQPESFSFQSISVVPPLKATPEQEKAARKKAEDALKQAKATKNYQDFGLLAEKVSEDDFRVNMGDHKVVAADKLPPQVVKVLSTLPTGGVSGIIQIETAFTVIRLNAHTAGRKQPFAEVKKSLSDELRKSKYEKLRSNLAKQLRAKAKIQVS
ncbi:MAG TPA: peptidyl-prolyl cis-trans isomerase [Candidatus Sulfotelmatobacter sp.]|nr:peptidyl-prolyl cis-trans isomerase [Candidatus Sulfotelmatobacter sp.]